MTKAKKKNTKKPVKNRTVKNRTVTMDFPDETLLSQAIELYKGFHHRGDVKVHKETIDDPKIWLYLGTGKKLYYTSDKRLYGDEKVRDYVHDFKKHGRLLIGITNDKITQILITDLDIRVKPEGIVG